MSFDDDVRDVDPRPWLSGESCARCCDPVAPEDRRIVMLATGPAVVHRWCVATEAPRGRMTGPGRCSP